MAVARGRIIGGVGKEFFIGLLSEPSNHLSYGVGEPDCQHRPDQQYKTDHSNTLWGKPI